MKKSQTTEHDIFTVSGCLSPSGLDLYSRGKLVGEDLKVAEEHLESCELCIDAAEGMKSYYSSEVKPRNNSEILRPERPNIQSISDSLNEKVRGSAREHSTAGSSKKHVTSTEYWMGIAAGILLLLGIYFVSEPGIHIPRLSGISPEEGEVPAFTSPGDTLIIAAPPGIQLSSNIPYLPDTYTDTAKGILINPRDQVMQLVIEPPAEIPLMKEKTTGNPEEKASAHKTGSEYNGPGSKKAEQGDGAGKELYGIEQPPLFPGGDKALAGFILKYLQYPQGLKSHGTVYLSFLVTEDGSLTEIKVIQGFNEECNKSAIHLLNKMPRWIPALQDGKPVKAISFLKVQF